MKKGFIITLAMLAGATMFTFAACKTSNGTSCNGTFTPTDGTNVTSPSGSDTASTLPNNTKGAYTALSCKIYAIGAASTAELIEAEKAEDTTVATKAQVTATSSPLQVKEQSEKFDEYYTLITDLFSNDKVQSSVQTNADAAYSQYEVKLNINGLSANNCIVYYTETLAKSKIDSKKTKDIYALEGVMLIDGNEYALFGERSDETKADETENSLTLRAYPDENDRTSFIQMEHEYETEANETETEYTYSVYKAGKLAEKTQYSFEYEVKANKQETSYEFEYIKDNEFGEYEITTKTVNGVESTFVEYKVGTVSPKQTTEEGEFEVKQTESGVEYIYTDNTTKQYKHKK